MKLGVLREEKNPPDKRVPLTPLQCVEIQDKFKVEVVVQSSAIRAYTDQEYTDAGLVLQEDLQDCDILLGVKEVPAEKLIAQKKYFFFSHTYKKQPYNRNLLQAILQKKIQLIDYEVIKDKDGKRLVAFGRYAGIVGAYNALRAYGQKSNSYTLKEANLCHDKKEMNAQLADLNLPQNFKIAITGKGRVANGAIETLRAAKIKKVTVDDYLSKSFKEPVYTVLGVADYNTTKDGSPFNRGQFFKDPSGFVSNFMPFAKVTNLYIACHYWDNKAPYIFSREDAKNPDFNIEIVADVSCDINGPVASTLRPSTIAAPFYGYNAVAESEVDFSESGSIGVMAVDNLPCELPRDASVDFGRDLIDLVFPALFGNDEDDIIGRASETKNGQLTPQFSYLENYVKGIE